MPVLYRLVLVLIVQAKADSRISCRLCGGGSSSRRPLHRQPNGHGSHNAVSREITHWRPKFTHGRANSGILGETRRGVLHARERTRVRDRTGTVPTTQYHAKLRIGDPNLRTGEPIAEFWVRQGVGFCTRGSAHGCVTERARFPQRSITRNYALAILERLSLSIAIFSFSFLAASR